MSILLSISWLLTGAAAWFFAIEQTRDVGIRIFDLLMLLVCTILGLCAWIPIAFISDWYIIKPR